MISPALSAGLGSTLTVTAVSQEGEESTPLLAWLQTKVGLTLIESEKVTSEPLDDVVQSKDMETKDKIIDVDNDASQSPTTVETVKTKVPVVAVECVMEDSPLMALLGPLLKQQEDNTQATLPVIVSTVNGIPCTTLSDVTKVVEQVEVGQAVTVQCQIEGGHDKLVHVVVLKPTPDAPLGMKLQHSNYSGGQMLLTVDNIVPSSLLEYSPLQKGDLILAINGEPCHEMPPADAAQLMRSTVSKPFVSILALQPGPSRTQRFLRQAKRAGVAVGGGAMVGIGLVFIPTLPPPFGEVLIAGGVSFLATEFEGPRKVVRTCRDSLERVVGREDETITTVNGNDESEADDDMTGVVNTVTVESSGPTETAAQDDSDSVTPESTVGERQAQESAIGDQAPAKKTLKSRLKNFGRNHVLPFLDQVVGDKTVDKTGQSQDKGTGSESNTADVSCEDKKSED
jgi:hypothetical protein